MEKYIPSVNDCVFITTYNIKVGDKYSIDFICHRRRVYCKLQPSQQKDLLPFHASGLTFRTDCTLAAQWYQAIPEITNTINQNLDIWLQSSVATTNQVSQEIYNAVFERAQYLEQKIYDVQKEAVRIVAESGVNKYIEERDVLKKTNVILESQIESVKARCQKLQDKVDESALATPAADVVSYLQSKVRDLERTLGEERATAEALGPHVIQVTDFLVDDDLRSIACLCSMIHLKKEISSGLLITTFKTLRALTEIEKLLRGNPESEKLYRKGFNRILDLTGFLVNSITPKTQEQILRVLSNLRSYNRKFSDIAPKHVQIVTEWPQSQHLQLVEWVLPQFKACSASLDSRPPTPQQKSDNEPNSTGNFEKITLNDLS
jgi:hypothetical protein